MVNSMSFKVKAAAIAVAVIILCSLCAALYLFFSVLAEFITGPASFLLFLASFVIFMKTVIQVVVFPGSFWLWRRNIESHFCREMSSQANQRFIDLRIAMEILLEGSLDRERTDFLPRSIAATAHSKRLIEILIETFEQLKKEGSLKRRQLTLFTLLVEFKAALNATKLKLTNQSLISLWDWFDAELEDADYNNVVFEDYPHNTAGLAAHSIGVRIEAFLSESWGQVSCFQRVKRWLFDNTLGNIDQMRVELVKRFKSEGFWVTAQDGKSLDCLWLWTEDSKSETPCVLLCNPNAGFYEFAYYQSEWLEFYLQNGVNVCMWNYRGYGRSGGRPTVSRIQRDAVSVFKHLKEVRGVTRIGAHGESMGGCVVTYLAAQCHLEFVFADRTFWSLEKTAYFNFGRAARVLLRLFSGKSSNSAENYLTAKCHKFLSSDPKDTMINDLSSLKAGVAETIMQTSAQEIRILPKESLKSLTEAYSRLMKLITEFERSPRSVKLLSVLQSTPEASQNLSQYQLLSKDSDALDDEVLTTLIFRVSNALYSLDAGGKSLMQVHYSKHLLASMQSWLLVFDVWGSFQNIIPSDVGQTRSIGLDRLKKCCSDLQKLVAEHEFSHNPLIIQVCSDLGVLVSCFMKVVYYLEDRLPKPGDASGSTVDSYARVALDYSRAGFLIPLTCGHSGPYNIPERMLYEEHLVRIGFFSS